MALPPPSPNMRTMLPLPTPPTQGMANEMDRSNVGKLVMDLAKDGSENGTSTTTDKAASTVLPAPTKKSASMIPPAPTAKEGRTIPAVHNQI